MCFSFHITIFSTDNRFVELQGLCLLYYYILLYCVQVSQNKSQYVGNELFSVGLRSPRNFLVVFVTPVIYCNSLTLGR